MKYLGQGEAVEACGYEHSSLVFRPQGAAGAMLSGVIIRNLAGDILYHEMFPVTLWVRRGTAYMIRLSPPVTTDDPDGVDWYEA